MSAAAAAKKGKKRPGEDESAGAAAAGAHKRAKAEVTSSSSSSAAAAAAGGRTGKIEVDSRKPVKDEKDVKSGGAEAAGGAVGGKKVKAEDEHKRRRPKKEGDDEKDAFIALCNAHPEGLRDDALSTELSSISITRRQDIVNELMAMGRLKLFKEADGGILYKLVTIEVMAKMDKLKPNDIAVFTLIENSKKNGMWIKDIRQRSGLTQVDIQKSLKVLTTRQLIKCHKIAGDQMKNRRVYVLFDVEPGKDLAGGPWYVNGNFDEEFFSHLLGACKNMVTAAGPKGTTATKVAAIIAKSGAFTVPCAADDVSRVLLALLYDGAIEICPTEEQIHLLHRKPPHFVDVVYRSVVAASVQSEATTIPCAVCPIVDQCCDDGVINPRDCKYYEAYLSF